MKGKPWFWPTEMVDRDDLRRRYPVPHPLESQTPAGRFIEVQQMLERGEITSEQALALLEWTSETAS